MATAILCIFSASSKFSFRSSTFVKFLMLCKTSRFFSGNVKWAKCQSPLRSISACRQRPLAVRTKASRFPQRQLHSLNLLLTIQLFFSCFSRCSPMNTRPCVAFSCKSSVSAQFSVAASTKERMSFPSCPIDVWFDIWIPSNQYFERDRHGRHHGSVCVCVWKTLTKKLDLKSRVCARHWIALKHQNAEKFREMTFRNDEKTLWNYWGVEMCHENQTERTSESNNLPQQSSISVSQTLRGSPSVAALAKATSKLQGNGSSPSQQRLRSELKMRCPGAQEVFRIQQYTAIWMILEVYLRIIFRIPDDSHFSCNIQYLIFFCMFWILFGDPNFELWFWWCEIVITHHAWWYLLIFLSCLRHVWDVIGNPQHTGVGGHPRS